MKRMTLLFLIGSTCVAALGCGSGDGGATTMKRAETTIAPPVVLNPGEECGKPRARPPEIVLACADWGMRLTRLTWRTWGAKVATATGAISVIGCDPDCASDNRLYLYKVDVRAVQPMTCPGGRRQYAFINYSVSDDHFDEHRPDDGTRGYTC
jgi:hypothetical protein